MKPLYKVSLALNLLIIAALIYLAFNGKTLVKDFVFNRIIKGRIEQKESMFRAGPITHGAIIFVGNSITEGGNWSELFPDKVILNRGIGGDVTEGVLQRIDEVTRHRPAKIFLCIGTNDLAKGIAEATILQQYRAILDTIQAQSPETRIYVQSVLPVGKDLITGHSNEKIIPLNAALKQLCLERKLTYIDLFPLFTDSTGYLNPAYTNDQLHLLGNGYLLWKKTIEPYMNETNS
ncbi:MAG: sialate O-acetylesterase [Bacteroidetes bacterium]|nr:sialate O-acetylesterase [Bacteroidota bacterium]